MAFSRDDFLEKRITQFSTMLVPLLSDNKKFEQNILDLHQTYL